MFKITVVCEDKKLAQALQCLQGLVLANPDVQPIVNAQVKSGQLSAQTDGTMSEMLRQFVKKNKVSGVTVADVKVFLKSIGKSPTSYSHCLSESLKAGWLKKTGKGTGTRYVVKS